MDDGSSENNNLSNPFTVEGAESWDKLNTRNDYDDKQGDAWVYYQEDEGVRIYQGWKIHISSEPEMAKEVIKSIGPWLRDNSIDHKWVANPYRLQRFEGSGQENKAITIYPPMDDQKIGDITVEAEDTDGELKNFQFFRYGDQEHNQVALNPNLDTTKETIEKLSEILENDNILSGPRIDGHHQEEFQVGDTRIHYRYSVSNSDGVMISGDEKSILNEELINKNGEVVSKESYVEPPNGAIHPLDSERI